ncbi:glycosyltransferase [Oceanobacter antarcticus]|uniref:Glycosyltransferase n=1 Tax=Oceanobacter antarcticus TaxID=3133425 RepID=A0ABW8NGA1_9GAMM
MNEVFYNYILLDPVGSKSSGISKYCNDVYDLLCESSLFSSVYLFSKNSSEDIKKYQKRVVSLLDGFSKSGNISIVEVPEAYAILAGYSEKNIFVHVRLHCAYTLAASIQGMVINEKLFEEEKSMINNADFLSSPSYFAWIATSRFFGVHRDVVCYPNPIRNKDCNTNNTISSDSHQKKVCFVGRWQSLKGVGLFTDEFILSLKSDFYIISNDVPSSIAQHENVKVIDGMKWSPEDIYGVDCIVIVPSLFETASMVAIEALSYGASVVCWSHLGVCEYAANDKVKRVSAWDSNAFLEVIKEEIANGNENSSDEFIRKINDRFSSGIRSIGSRSAKNFLPFPPCEINDVFLNSLLSGKYKDKFMSKPTPRFIKKTRKLFRNPKSFFKDSRYFNFLDVKKKATNLDSPKNNPSKKNVTVEPSQKEITKENKKPVSTSPFIELGKEGDIGVGNVPEKPLGMISVLMYPVGRAKEIEGRLLDKCLQFTDFRYLQRPFLQIGKYPPELNTEVSELIRMVGSKGMDKLSSVDNYILIDPPRSVLIFLRAVGTRPRIIVVRTKVNCYLPEVDEADVVILRTDESHHRLKEYRKVVAYNNIGVEFTIRKVLQDLARKDPDFLLPIVGFESSGSLDEFNGLSVGSILKISSATNLKSSLSSGMAYKEIAGNVVELAVRESVYLRYQNLLDLPNEVSLEGFLKASSRDGVIHHVIQ